MARRRWTPFVVAAALALVAALPALAQAPPATDPATARERKLLEGLRDRGDAELALDFVRYLRTRNDLPPELASTLDYEEGRAILDVAKTTGDINGREPLFDEARDRFDAFLKAQPNSPLAAEVRLQLAQILVQRGQTAVLQANEATDEKKAQASRTAARASFDQARAAYDQAVALLDTEFKKFPVGFIPEEDPKRQQRDEAQARWLDAMLRRGLIDYEDAQTYPAGSDERNQKLDAAIERFGLLARDYRPWLSGLAAQMWRGKSYEEKGMIGEAMGDYNALLQHSDPIIRNLQQQVAYFKIIAHRKREEYALAADFADAWLKADTGPFSLERLGVMLELARNLDAQLAAGKAADDEVKQAASDRIVGLTGEVIKYSSPLKPDAVTLYRKYRPNPQLDKRTLASLTFEQAIARAREQIAAREWTTAIAYLQVALARGNPDRELDALNEARFLLAFAYHEAGQNDEAAVLASFIARRYPQSTNGASAGELALSSIARAYEAIDGASPTGPAQRAALLRRLGEMAQYAIDTWPSNEQGDTGRLILGDIALGQGRYADAAKLFEQIASPTRKLDAQGKTAVSYWRQALALRKQAGDATPPPEAEALAKKAVDTLTQTYEARRNAQTSLADPTFLTNANDLAEIHLVDDRPEEALKVLAPHVAAARAAGNAPGIRPLLSRALRLQLQAHITAGQTDAALADMKLIEEISQGESLTQLYFGLGRLLQRDLDDHRSRGDQAGAERLGTTYQKFLEQLVSSQAGQSFESLQWAGEAMLDLGQGAKAREVFARVLKDYAAEPRIDRTRIKVVSALRTEGLITRNKDKSFEQAWAEVDRLLKKKPNSLDFLRERAQLLEDWAAVEKGRWATAIKYWQDLANKLSNERVRRPEFYDAWYHVAYCQLRSGKKDEARRTLKSVTALAKSMPPEMKQKYDQLLAQASR